MEQRSDFYDCKLPEDNLLTLEKIELFGSSVVRRLLVIGPNTMVL